MSRYFRSWKRKLGVVTLVVACVFAAGWLRTYSTEEQIMLTRGGPSHVFTAKNGCLRWTRYYGLSLPAYSRERSPAGAKVGVNEPLDVAEIDWKWRWQWCGFEFGEGGLIARSSVKVSAIPYWSLVLPLALLSAWLLLTKSHVPKRKPMLAFGARS